MQFFTGTDSGSRYATFRPKVHGIVLDVLARHLPGRRFRRAADVACGTGDSLAPLQDISDEVLGIDSSEEMLAIAAARGLPVRRADYTSLPEHGPFDLISTCMAIHWFDPPSALAAYKAASTPGAIWLIYNFAFGGHDQSAAFNAWFQDQYLNSYPSPPRTGPVATDLAEDPDLRELANHTGWLPITFDLEALVGYLTTQSNIEAALRQGHDLATIRTDLSQQIGALDLDGPFRYVYGYRIYAYRSDSDGDDRRGPATRVHEKTE